jgi:hypothetical protein
VPSQHFSAVVRGRRNIVKKKAKTAKKAKKLGAVKPLVRR